MAGNFFDMCFICTFGACMGGCVFVLVSAFPIAEIVLGAVYIYECPAAPAIPVYVMVCGIVALLLMLMTMVLPLVPNNLVRTLFMLAVVLFAVVWFIFGSYHIYSIYPPNYTKIDMDPNSLNSSISTPTAPDKTGFTSENQNQSTPNLNRTWMINKNNNNNNQTSTRVNVSNNNERNLTETLARVNISNNNERNLTETLARVNISNNERNLTETLARVNISNNERNLTEALARVNISNERNLTETLARVDSSNKRNLTETLARVNISSEANREYLNAPQTRHVAAARPYCQRTLYLFAFWTTTLAYALTGFSLFISICVFCFLKIAQILTEHLF